MSKKAWIIFAVVCVAVLGGLVYFSGKNKIDVGTADNNKIQAASEQSGGIADHVFGKADSKVVFIEYGDFQCPGCGNAYPTVKKVTEKYKDQVAFVFRNFPITSLHPNARTAAAVAEAAGLQGKYWEMHSKLYETQSNWENLSANERIDFFTTYAKELALHTETFKADLSSSKVGQKISYDQALGKKNNITSTPTFYLNGESVDQAVWSNEAKLDEAFAAELKKHNLALPAEN